MKAALAGLLACTVLASPAWALRDPKAGKQDGRMQVVPYSADDIVPLHGVMGRTLAITLSPKETATDAWGPDKSKLLSDLSGNNVMLKPVAADSPEPLMIKSRREDGSTRLYTFQYQADATDDQAPYMVRFTYPADAAAARSAAWRKAAAAREAKRAEAALQTTALPVSNMRYVGQGDWQLLPSRHVWDDGQSTFFDFPANSRIPAIYTVAPDGKETLVNTSVQGGIVTVHQTAPMFRLRDGDAVLCVFNLGYSAVGVNPGTGTTSPDVVREIKR